MNVHRPYSMRAYRTSVFCSALAAILSPVIAGEQSAIKHRLLKPTSSSREQQQIGRKVISSSATASVVLDSADFALGPEPFFDDLFHPAAEIGVDLEDEREDVVVEAGPARRTTYLVEVYENEARWFGHWRQLPSALSSSNSVGVRPSMSLRWSYKVCMRTILQDWAFGPHRDQRKCLTANTGHRLGFQRNQFPRIDCFRLRLLYA